MINKNIAFNPVLRFGIKRKYKTIDKKTTIPLNKDRVHFDDIY